MNRAALIILASAAVVLAAPSLASAGTLHATSEPNYYCFCTFTAVTFTGNPGEGNHVTVAHYPDPTQIVVDAIPFPIEGPRDQGTYVITDVVPLTITGEGCSAGPTPYAALCNAGGGVTGNLGDRNDSLQAETSVTFSGGTGNDRLIGGGPWLTGADGNDYVVGSGETRGGNGDDVVVATAGKVSCGAGNDIAIAPSTTRPDADCETKVARP